MTGIYTVETVRDSGVVRVMCTGPLPYVHVILPEGLLLYGSIGQYLVLYVPTGSLWHVR